MRSFVLLYESSFCYFPTLLKFGVMEGKIKEKLFNDRK
jgi:hypothetical protein